MPLNPFPTLDHACETDLERVYNLMEEAFPPTERRSKAGQMAVFKRPGHHTLVKRGPDGSAVGFIICWELAGSEGPLFLEHFAVDSSIRGGGLGSGMLKEFLEHIRRPSFLEAEPPELGDIPARRVAFYERMGFHVNPFPYLQPPLQPGQEPIPLVIMSRPGLLEEAEFKQCERIAKEVANYENQRY